MANAHETMRAQIEASTWAFMLGTATEWRDSNPHGSMDDFLKECRQQESRVMERLIEVEVENGSTREEAERMTRMMR